MIKVFMDARLTRDPEARDHNGNTIVEVNVAANSTRKDEKGDYVPLYFRCAFWNNAGTVVQQYFKKGDQIILTGDFDQHTYTTQSGEFRVQNEIRSVSFSFGAKSKMNSGNAVPEVTGTAVGVTEAQAAATPMTQAEDDDLPF